MKTPWKSSILVLLASLLAGLVPEAKAQRSFTLTLTPTNQNGLVISWTARSATPAGDLVLVPQFRVERSPDLKAWTPISAKLSASPGQVLSLVDSNSSQGF